MTTMTDAPPLSPAEWRAERAAAHASAAAEQAATLRAIADPTERFNAASEMWQRVFARAEAARSMRDMATIVAHLDHGVAPVALYRDALGVSRGLFVRIIQRAPAKRENIPDPVTVATESADAARRHDAVLDAIRPVRNEAMLTMMSGYTDPNTGETVPPMSNADVARATGLSTARIAQVRTDPR